MDSSPTNTDEYGDHFHSRVANVNQSLEDFHVDIDLSSPDVAERFREVAAELREDRERVAAFAERIRESAGEAVHELRDAAERAIERLEGDVSTARADLRAELAADPAEYREAAQAQAETWKAHLERLRLHAKLGEMEARDTFTELEGAYERAKPELERAGEVAADTFHALKSQVSGVVAHLRKAARDFSKSL